MDVGNALRKRSAVRPLVDGPCFPMQPLRLRTRDAIDTPSILLVVPQTQRIVSNAIVVVEPRRTSSRALVVDKGAYPTRARPVGYRRPRRLVDAEPISVQMQRVAAQEAPAQ